MVTADPSNAGEDEADCSVDAAGFLTVGLFGGVVIGRSYADIRSNAGLVAGRVVGVNGPRFSGFIVSMRLAKAGGLISACF